MLGDHLRKRRLDLGWFQREVARQLGITTETICHWETNQTSPVYRDLPRIFEFLGYVPFQPGETLSEKLLFSRKILGLSRLKLAKMLGADEGTLLRWERGKAYPVGNHLKAVEELFGRIGLKVN